MSAALELVVVEYACAWCASICAADQLITVDGECICAACHGEPVSFIGPIDSCAECGDVFDADVLRALEGVGRRGRCCPECWSWLAAEDAAEQGELEADSRETVGGPRWI